MADNPGLSERLLRVEGALLAFEWVFAKVMTALYDGGTIDQKMFNDEILDGVTAMVRRELPNSPDAETRRTFEAALRLLQDLRAGRAGPPFEVIQGGRKN